MYGKKGVLVDYGRVKHDMAFITCVRRGRCKIRLGLPFAIQSGGGSGGCQALSVRDSPQKRQVSKYLNCECMQWDIFYYPKNKQTEYIPTLN